MSTNRVKEARAVEVGYGYTKYSLGINDRGIPIVHSFPSWVLRGREKSIGTEKEHSLDLVNVEVNGQRYRVGKDSALEAHGMDRLRTADFCMRDEYQALVAGALHYSHSGSELDMLILGLPVKRLRNYRDALIEKFTGMVLTLPDREINIHNVRVFAQPYGGLVNWAMSKNKDKIQKLATERTLVVDPGHGTLDWLVTDGFKVIDARSDAVEDAGMGSVLRRIKSAVEEDEVEKLNGGSIDIDLLDMALINQSKARGLLRNISFDKYREIGRDAVNEAIDRMLTSCLGDTSDIDTVLVIGGGAPIYAEELVKRFKGKEVIVTDAPMTVNAAGMHYLGMKILKEMTA